MTERIVLRDDLRIEDPPEDQVIVLPDVLEFREARAHALADTETEQRRSRTAVWLLIAVCLLNSIDALMTQTVLSHGLAVEGNPVIRSIGLFPKLILVPLAAEAVYLLKPKALWIPFVALLGVIAYTTISVLVVT